MKGSRSRTCKVRIQDQKHVNNRHVKPGNFIQVIKANLDDKLKEIILDKDTVVITWRKFSTIEEIEDTDQNNNKAPEKEFVKPETMELTSVNKLPPNTVYKS